MGARLESRRAKSIARFGRIKKELADATKLATSKACVYATGSFGRNEASDHSDVDLFIVGRSEKGVRALSPLNEICLKADLIEATRRLEIPDFSGDGQYLVHYAIDDLVQTLGEPDDDATNTFTARLLLILESRPLIGSDVYSYAIERVIAAYWRDYADHKKDFVPAFLANDILRLWRTFCVNYEARTETDPPEKKAKRKLKNYKLKHSRLLTCYSGLLYLLATFGRSKTVTPEDASRMIGLTPTKRLEALLTDVRQVPARKALKGLLERYESFLSETDATEKELIERFLDKSKSKRYFSEANEFGSLMFSAIESIGNRSRFHRLLVV